eukprot:792526-Rhodomonas_salina.4
MPQTDTSPASHDLRFPHPCLLRFALGSAPSSRAVCISASHRMENTMHVRVSCTSTISSLSSMRSDCANCCANSPGNTKPYFSTGHRLASA